VHVFDLGLQLAAVLLGDFAAEDDGDFVRLADRAVASSSRSPSLSSAARR